MSQTEVITEIQFRHFFPNPNPNRVRGFNPDVMDGYPDVYNF